MTARKPRKVSVSAIFADVKQLSGEVMTQTQEARDDVVRTVTRRSESVRTFGGIPVHVDTRESHREKYDSLVFGTSFIVADAR